MKIIKRSLLFITTAICAYTACVGIADIIESKDLTGLIYAIPSIIVMVIAAIGINNSIMYDKDGFYEHFEKAYKSALTLYDKEEALNYLVKYMHNDSLFKDDDKAIDIFHDWVLIKMKEINER